MAEQGLFELYVGRTDAQNPRNSESAIIPLNDGRLLLGWTEFYAGDGADHGPAKLVGRISNDRGRSWGDKYTLVEDDGGCNVMEVNFLRLQSGEIALFYCQKNMEDEDCRVMLRRSADEGSTFGAAQQLSANGVYTGLTNGRALRLGTGRILIEAWANDDSYCYISDDDGASWCEGGRTRPKDGGSWEPACVELADGRVMLLTRTHLGSQYKAVSVDGGMTWSEPEPTALTGTAAPIAVTRVPETGDLLAIWTHNPGGVGRNPLTSALSSDEGESWDRFKNLEDEPGNAWAYPAVTWVDGIALITYFDYKDRLSLKLKAVSTEWFYATEGT
ncbi:MAG: exo-alpha-sialidase [Lentisphaeria bacterium]|nr:exo-alpha-sialidase [Lentisphaeria bacterium]